MFKPLSPDSQMISCFKVVQPACLLTGSDSLAPNGFLPKPPALRSARPTSSRSAATTRSSKQVHGRATRAERPEQAYEAYGVNRAGQILDQSQGAPGPSKPAPRVDGSIYLHLYVMPLYIYIYIHIYIYIYRERDIPIRIHIYYY